VDNSLIESIPALARLVGACYAAFMDTQSMTYQPDAEPITPVDLIARLLIEHIEEQERTQ
jgi:hypothetical protein